MEHRNDSKEKEGERRVPTKTSERRPSNEDERKKRGREVGEEGNEEC